MPSSSVAGCQKHHEWMPRMDSPSRKNVSRKTLLSAPRSRPGAARDAVRLRLPSEDLGSAASCMHNPAQSRNRHISLPRSMAVGFAADAAATICLLRLVQPPFIRSPVSRNPRPMQKNYSGCTCLQVPQTATTPAAGGWRSAAAGRSAEPRCCALAGGWLRPGPPSAAWPSQPD